MAGRLLDRIGGSGTGLRHAAKVSLTAAAAVAVGPERMLVMTAGTRGSYSPSARIVAAKAGQVNGAVKQYFLRQ